MSAKDSSTPAVAVVQEGLTAKKTQSASPSKSTTSKSTSLGPTVSKDVVKHVSVNASLTPAVAVVREGLTAQRAQSASPSKSTSSKSTPLETDSVEERRQSS